MSRSYFRNRFETGDIPQYKVGKPLFNYFGNGEDGDLIIDSNVSLPSVEDGDMIVKQYKSLNINSGFTFTTQNRCRGLMIYVQNDCIINGTISMTARGCKANPNIGGTDQYTPVAPSDGNPVHASGLRIPMKTATGTDILAAANFSGCGNAAVNVVSHHKSIDGDGTIFKVERMGGVTGKPGESGISLCGGGGYGGGSASAGSQATCFGGGPGGGGGYRNFIWEVSGGPSEAYGGAGGAGGSYGSSGKGNPSGGTGGLLILIVGGNLIIGSSGVIQSNGTTASNAERGGGGGSGGGLLMLLYSGILTNNGSITSNGGSGGSGSLGWGGNGGNGDIQIEQIL